MAEFNQLRSQLEERLGQLESRVERIEGHLRQPGDRDWQERATEAENDEVLERLGEAELRELEDIRTALRRMDSGTYGTCAKCGGAIGEKRLEAVPYATHCIDCAD